MMIMIMAIFSAIGIVAVLGRIVWVITKVMEARENLWSNIRSLKNDYRLLAMRVATLEWTVTKMQNKEKGTNDD